MSMKAGRRRRKVENMLRKEFRTVRNQPVEQIPDYTMEMADSTWSSNNEPKPLSFSKGYEENLYGTAINPF
ncbi:hypothetical protein [Aneurinibacillus tyrosinisolvens]|uniref:hypothetical protein n=1 Tax=Aneurinibacillus tyrosinisolvens TaxID=1443435 RepID=UPI00063F60B6|nr:hypothetical protein [Aneurinibacillus tyrosinisolvens]